MDAGLSVPYIANLENGRGNPTVAALDRLAEALGTRLEVRIGETVDELPSVGAELVDASPRSDDVIKAVEGRGRARAAVQAELGRTIEALGNMLAVSRTTAHIDRAVDLVLLVDMG